MKVTTVIGSAIAALGLAACGSTVAPTVSPTLALTVGATVATIPSATPTAIPISTPAPSENPSPSPSATPSASPSPTEGPCGYQPCGTGAGWTTTCGSPGAGQGGSLIVTWTAGYGQTEPVVPDYITVDGNVVDVTSNPFTSGPYTVGNHSFTSPTDEGPNENGWFPFTVVACGVVTVTTTCSSYEVGPNGTGTVTLSGLTVGDYLNLEDTGAFAITSTTYTQTDLAPGTDTYAETNGDTTVASGTFTIAACPGKTIR